MKRFESPATVVVPDAVPARISEVGVPAILFGVSLKEFQPTHSHVNNEGLQLPFVPRAVVEVYRETDLILG